MHSVKEELLKQDAQLDVHTSQPNETGTGIFYENLLRFFTLENIFQIGTNPIGSAGALLILKSVHNEISAYKTSTFR